MPLRGNLNFMSRRYAPLALLLAAVSLPVILMLRADEPGRSPATITSTAKTNEAKALEPSPDDGEIAYVTARALEQGHYRQHPFDNDYSGKFFDRYLEALDPQRLHFTQEDLKEFAQYRDKLDNLTLGKRRAADTTPAYRIFNRFRERLDQRVAYAVELLKNEKFEFDTDDQITVNRKDEPYPLDLDEARQLWRQRLRSEYLQEKIAKYAAKQKAERDAKGKNKTSSADNNNGGVEDLPLAKTSAHLTPPPEDSLVRSHEYVLKLG